MEFILDDCAGGGGGENDRKLSGNLLKSEKVAKTAAQFPIKKSHNRNAFYRFRNS